MDTKVVLPKAERSLTSRFVLAFLLTFGVVLVASGAIGAIWYSTLPVYYDLFSVKGGANKHANWSMECIRWIVFVSVTIVVWLWIDVLCWAFPRWLGRAIRTSAKFVRGQRQGAHKTTSSVGLLQYVHTLLSLCLISLFMLFWARAILFDSSTLALFATSQTDTPRVPMRVHLERLLTAATVLAAVVAAEKWLIAWLRRGFEQSAMEERLTQSTFRIHVIETLHRGVVYQSTAQSSAGAASSRLPADRTRRVSQIMDDPQMASAVPVKSAKQAKAIGKKIFRLLGTSGTITAADLRAYFSESPTAAEQAFAALDRSRLGKLDEADFCAAIIEAYRERDDLFGMLEDGTKIIGKIDFCLLSTVLLVVSLGYMAAYAERGHAWLVEAGGILFTYSFMLDGVISDIFSSLIFILVEHPYDVGDTVIIDGVKLRVAAIDIFTSTFLRVDTGAVMYKLNKNVAVKNILNPHRSHYDYDRKRVRVKGAEASMRQLFDIKDALKAWLIERDPEFVGAVNVKPAIDIADPTGKPLPKPRDIIVTIEAQYRVKVEDAHHRLERQRQLEERVKGCLESANLQATFV